MSEDVIFAILSISFGLFGCLASKFDKLFWPFLIYTLYMFFYLLCALVCFTLGLLPYFSALRVLGLFITFAGFKGLNLIVDIMIGKD